MSHTHVPVAFLLSLGDSQPLVTWEAQSCKGWATVDQATKGAGRGLSVHAVAEMDVLGGDTRRPGSANTKQSIPGAHALAAAQRPDAGRQRLVEKWVFIPNPRNEAASRPRNLTEGEEIGRWCPLGRVTGEQRICDPVCCC